MIRAASGIQRYGSAQIAAPYSLIAKSKEASGRPVSSALPWISGKWRSCSSWRRRAVFSCSAELSIQQRCVDLVPVDAVAGDVLGQLGFGHRRIVASPVARQAGESAKASGWPILTVVKVTHCDGAGREGYGRRTALSRESWTRLLISWTGSTSV
jgi:hypothetical protein